ncbi:helix-turn-helix domain-containing protein [Streptomyces sp. NPDC056653]|uniref:helix-turn-helix domain-containing protein n=1 Tax=Streptomyces sp. NPDC056653 TaxID=3345894 RepID=UPI0036943FC2
MWSDQICGASAGQRRSARPLWRRRPCEAIRQAPGRPWTTSLAAVYTHMNPRSLHRRFTAATGLSLARWVQQARLVHAVTLLARNTPVTAVAIGLGYATPSAFTAMFRRALGTTPSAYFADGEEAHRQTGPQ